MLECTETHRVNRVVAGRESGQHYDRQSLARGHRAQLFEQLDAAHIRHPEVEERAVNMRAAREELKRLAAPLCLDDGMPQIAKGFGKAVTEGAVVVDDQDVRHGNSITKQAPCSRAA
jgi:hypothetical protein